MRVTIYTDASHIRNTNKGTYAFWIRFDNGRIVKNGKLKGSVKDSLFAEVRCILNAIYTAKQAVPNVTGICIVTDCKPAINLLDLRNNKPETLIKFNTEISVFDIMTTGIRIKFKHTMAHTGSNSIKSYINDQCDKLAKEAHQNKRKC